MATTFDILCSGGCGTVVGHVTQDEPPSQAALGLPRCTSCAHSGFMASAAQLTFGERRRARLAALAPQVEPEPLPEAPTPEESPEAVLDMAEPPAFPGVPPEGWEDAIENVPSDDFEDKDAE